MDEIVSTVVANGVWAVLFCLLLVYELRDSRRRESRYTETISALTDRLNAVVSVKSDTEEIKNGTQEIKSDTEEIKAAVAPRGAKRKKQDAATGAPAAPAACAT